MNGKLVYVVGGLMVVFGLIYWFGIRPIQIKKVCAEQSLTRSVFDAPESKIPNVIERTTAQERLEKEYYTNCIVINGLGY